MISNDIALAILIAGVLAGAFVASRNSEPAWKGGLVILAASLLPYLLLNYVVSVSQPQLWTFVLSIIAAGAVGSALKLSARLIVGIYVLALLAQVAVLYLAQQFL